MKRVIVFLLACFLILSSVSVSFAAAPVLSATRWCSPLSGFGGGSRVVPTDTVISYSDLCAYRSAANSWLGSGMYPGFHGRSTIVYTGSFYYIQMMQDGDIYWLCNSSGGRYRTQVEYKVDDTPTTVPSTTPPSIDKKESTESDSPYISEPTSPSNSTKELDALNRLVQFTFSQIKAIHGLWRTNIKMYNIQIKMRSLMWNMIDGINNITRGIYKQVDFLSAYLSRMDDICNRLFSIQSASWASVDVENRIYSSVSSIGSRLDSVISNGAVQVNTSSLEARLDKLISMYSKVNSVVLDTAAINGGQIKAAVGGELEDVVFWGNSVRSGSKFVTNTVQYALNGAVVRVYDISLRGLSIGNSVPDSVHVDDALIKSGIWQSGGKYRISDTYNAATGEYVQRVGSAVYDGSEAWKLVKKTDGCNLFYLVDSAFAGISGNTFCYSTRARFAYVPYDLALNTKPAAASAYANKFTVWGGLIRFCVPSDEFPDLAAWQKALANLSKAGTPLEVWYVRPSAVSTMLDRIFIGIPEGDSTIKADRIRITGKYETYDSYTQTADIINAINGIPTFDDTAVVGAIMKLENALSKPSTSVAADLTEVTTRLDKLIENSASKVENVTVNITEDNDAFNVFYVTTDGGNKKPVGEVAGDTLSASGKLLNFLYKLCFEGALSKAGESIDTMSSFYFDTGAGTEGSVWD